MAENSGFDRVFINRLTIVEEEIFNINKQLGIEVDNTSIEDDITLIKNDLSNYKNTNNARLTTDETAITLINNTVAVASYNFTIGMSWDSFVNLFNNSNTTYINIQPGIHTLTASSSVSLVKAISIRGNGAVFNISGGNIITFGLVELSNIDFGVSGTISLTSSAVARHVYFATLNTTGNAVVKMYECLIRITVFNNITSTRGLQLYSCCMDNGSGDFINIGTLYMYSCLIICNVFTCGSTSSGAFMTYFNSKLTVGSWIEIYNNEITFNNCNINVQSSSSVFRILQNLGTSTSRFKVIGCRIVADSISIDLFDFGISAYTVNFVTIIHSIIKTKYVGTFGVPISYGNNYFDYSVLYNDSNIIFPIFSMALSTNRSLALY